MRVVDGGGVSCAAEGEIVAPGRENSVKRNAKHCAYCVTREVSHFLEYRVPRSGILCNFFCGIFFEFNAQCNLFNLSVVRLI